MEQIFASSSPTRKCICTKFVGVHRSNIWVGASQLIISWFTIAAIALLYCWGKRVCSSGCVRRTLLEQIFAIYSPPSKCIGIIIVGVHHSNIRPGASPLIFNWFTIATIALVYWKSKKVCISGCVRRTLLEQIYASSSSPRKCIGTVLVGVHRSNIRPGASPLLFNWFTISSILEKQTAV